MAGIIGGNSEQYKGIAPQALLGIYRVFGEVGRTSTSIVLKALTLAIEEKKMKIITLPEIGVIDSNEENLRRKIKQASQNNVIMVAAATPNNYVNPKYFSYAGLPVLSVGGINLPYDMGHWFTHMSTGTKLLFTTTCRYMSYTFDDIDLVIASPLRPHNAITFDKPVNGKVILLPPYNYDNIGGLLSAAKSFGAKGVISIRKMSNAKHDCRVPLFIITPEEHEYLSERLNHRYAFKGEQGCLLDEKNIHISSAVSRNLPFTWPIRPDILAPSDAIMAPSPINKKNYVQLNDISAAVAYAAGSIALLVEAHRPINLGYKEIRDMFQNGARPLKDPTLDSYISAEYQGAGLMNLAKAAWPTIGVMPSVVDLSEASPQDKNKPIQLYIINLIGLHEYSISWKPANALLKCGRKYIRLIRIVHRY
ncbi:peptidase S8/S53 domain-containing protein [Syncephalis plumigaleata]|nr:peptidase S8/S53 domain-containing protein [Syncephalis plumigaleata]